MIFLLIRSYTFNPHNTSGCSIKWERIQISCGSRWVEVSDPADHRVMYAVADHITPSSVDSLKSGPSGEFCLEMRPFSALAVKPLDGPLEPDLGNGPAVCCNSCVTRQISSREKRNLTSHHERKKANRIKAVLSTTCLTHIFLLIQVNSFRSHPFSFDERKCYFPWGRVYFSAIFTLAFDLIAV